MMRGARRPEAPILYVMVGWGALGNALSMRTWGGPALEGAAAVAPMALRVLLPVLALTVVLGTFRWPALAHRLTRPGGLGRYYLLAAIAASASGALGQLLWTRLTGLPHVSELVALSALHQGLGGMLTIWFGQRDAEARQAVAEETARTEDTLQQLESARLLTATVSRRRQAEVHELLEGRVIHRLGELQDELAALGTCPAAQRAARIEQLADALEALREQEVRQTSHQLHPLVTDLGVAATLHFLADRAGPGLQVQVMILAGAPAGEPTAATCLLVYRCAEDILAQVARSAPGAAVQLAWQPDADSWRLRVQASGDVAAIQRALADLDLVEARLCLVGGRRAPAADARSGLELILPREA